MANKSKEVKGFPVPVALLIILVAVVLMVAFVIYLVTPVTSGETSHTDSLGEQSFAEETSVEPPPPVVEEIKEYMYDANVGDVVTYGSYEQNADTSDGSEPIEWIVLHKDEKWLLLVSRYCLACKPYNDTRENVTWEDSSLRSWLNGGFYDTAFTEKEQLSILEISETSSAENSPTVTDKVSMLSQNDAQKYYEYDSWRIASATPSAVAEGARVEKDSCWWWLRGGLFDSGDTAKYVYFNGAIMNQGFAVDYDALAVRPVIWVSAEAEKEPDESETSDISDTSSATVSE